MTYNTIKKNIVALNVPTTYNPGKTLLEYIYDKYLFIIVEQKHKLNINAYCEKNNINRDTACLLFTVLHEFGHVKQAIEQLEKYGDFELWDKEYSERESINRREMVFCKKYYSIHDKKNKRYIPVFNGIDINNNNFKRHLYKKSNQYRSIPSEYMADSFAIKCMNKYSNELIYIINNYNKRKSIVLRHSNKDKGVIRKAY